MERLAMVRIASRAAAHYTGTLADASVTEISTDSRSVTPGCLFIALQGENYDGHRFVDDALRQGAAYAMVMEKGRWPEEQILTVGDTREALMDIANLYRNIRGVKVVAVTGSVGKTTTKEMTACVLGEAMPTLKTEANLNNEVGLSHTILRLAEEHKAAVLELGIDGPGQMAPLSKCAQPDIAIITNVGVSHMEALGSRKGILEEKLAVTAGMADGAPLLLCGDNDMLATVSGLRQKAFLYGIDNPACVLRAGEVRELPSRTTFRLSYEGEGYDAEIPCPGKHNVYNALAAVAAGIHLGVPIPNALEALKKYEPAGMRQKIVTHNSYTVVEDCYNASPDSMKAALSTLGKLECSGKRIAVLGDMLELGGAAWTSHRTAGAQCAENGVDLLLCTGELARLYVEGARESGMENAFHFSGKEELFRELKKALEPGDVVWVKASRAMALESVISRIYKEC